MTVAVPRVPDDVVQLIVKLLGMLSEPHDDPPMLTVAPVRNPVPLIVTVVAPFFEPEDGVIPETVGKGL